MLNTGRGDGENGTHRAGTLPVSPRFHDQPTVNTESACPRPSIPWTCRPSSHAFRGGVQTFRPCPSCFGRLRRTCHRTRASVSASPMADRTADILLGMLDRPAGAHRRPAAGDTGARPYRVRGQRLYAQRRAPSARPELSGAAPQRTWRRTLARLLRRAHYHVGRTADFRRVLWQLPKGASSRMASWRSATHWAARCC